MESLISIIVPVYKVEQYLDECIQSIINQTYKNLEIILIDDGSPDNCPKKCDDWAKKDSRIKVIHRENGGISSVRNLGLDIAKGEYIGFVDSDDYIDSNLCEHIMSVFNNYSPDIVAFDFNLVDEEGIFLNSIVKSNHNMLCSKTAIRELLLDNITNYVWNKIYKKSVFNNVRCPKGCYMEDMSITYKLFLNSEKIYCLNEKLYYYRQRRNSIVNSVSLKLVSDTFTAQFTRYNHLKKIYPDIAELGFANVALAARALYDRSLWEAVDQNLLEEAKLFLEENRCKILKTETGKLFKIFFEFRILYNLYRIIRHKTGDMIKFIKSLIYKFA